MKKKILVVGSLNIDMCIRVGHMPRTGETLMAESLSYALGGKGANQAGAAGKSGADVVMLGCVGADEFGERQKSKLKENGVDVSRIGISGKKPTGTAVIYVDDSGNNSIVVVAGANDDCVKEYMESHDGLLKECHYVLLQMEIPVSAITYVVKRAKELGKTVVLNPAPAPGPLSDEILQNVDFLTPNETEIAALCGGNPETVEEIAEGAQKLLGRGVKNILVTMGDKGCMLVNRTGRTVYPARKVKAVDTTAAGDCFNGAFVAALAEGKNVEDAVMFASAASSIAVTRKGALDSVPARSETEDALAAWKAQTEEGKSV